MESQKLAKCRTLSRDHGVESERRDTEWTKSYTQNGRSRSAWKKSIGTEAALQNVAGSGHGMKAKNHLLLERLLYGQSPGTKKRQSKRATHSLGEPTTATHYTPLALL